MKATRIKLGIAGVVAGLAALSAALGGTVLAAGPAAANPHPPLPAGIEYVALGDSYTAAPLVPDLDPAAGCFRSTNNYPSLLSRDLGVAEFVDASCSGAQTKDMTESQLPGVAPQFNALSPDTDLVTISIGGNDSGVFGTLVGFCPTLREQGPTGAPCRDAMRADGRDRLFTALEQTRKSVSAVIQQARSLAPNARVLVVGYPQIVPSSGTCPELLPLADGDYRYGRAVNHKLTQTLRQAASENSVEYVDVWTASKGHDVCSTDPWINGAITDPTRAQNFHPFGNEQRAVADLIMAQLD